MGECNSSLDCFDDIKNIQKFCFESSGFRDDFFFCDCSLEIGWIGENCDMESPALLFHRYMHLLVVMLSFLLVILTVKTVVMSIWLRRNLKRFGELTFVTAVVNCLAAVAFFLHILIRLPGYFDASYTDLYNLTTISQGLEELVFLKHYSASLVLVSIANLLHHLSMVLALILFNNLLLGLSRFSSNSKIAKCWAFVLKGVLFFVLFAVLIFAGMQIHLDLSLLISALGGFFFAAVYPVYFVYLSKSLMKLSVSEDESIKRLVQIVVRVGGLLVILNISSAFVQLYNSVFATDYEENGILGEMNFFVATTDLWRLILILSIGIIAWFINTTNDATVLSDLYPNLCYIFSRWDYHNKMIFYDQEAVETIRTVFSHINTKALETI